MNQARQFELRLCGYGENCFYNLFQDQSGNNFTLAVELHHSAADVVAVPDFSNLFQGERNAIVFLDGDIGDVCKLIESADAADKVCCKYGNP